MTVNTPMKPDTGATWTTPELVRLGQIADVAGSPSGITQNAGKS